MKYIQLSVIFQCSILSGERIPFHIHRTELILVS